MRLPTGPRLRATAKRAPDRTQTGFAANEMASLPAEDDPRGLTGGTRHRIHMKSGQQLAGRRRVVVASQALLQPAQLADVTFRVSAKERQKEIGRIAQLL